LLPAVMSRQPNTAKVAQPRSSACVKHITQHTEACEQITLDRERLEPTMPAASIVWATAAAACKSARPVDTHCRRL
jgi:hypothetical protein